MNLKNVLNRIWDKTYFPTDKECRFEEIIGHQDIKRIFINAIISKNPVHILLVGSPGSAKTMFLTEINRLFKASLFVIASNATKAGIINQLFEKKPKFLLVDELEKMNTGDQTSLLHLMETGIISETKVNKTRHIELSSRVFATANSCEKIIEPLLSRFVVLEIPEYNFKEFKDVVAYRLKKENLDEMTAIYIAEKVWNELNSSDVRDAVKVGRLARNIQEVPFLVKMMKVLEKDR